MPDLTNEEEYENLRAAFKAKLLKRIEQEKAYTSSLNASIRVIKGSFEYKLILELPFQSCFEQFCT